MESSRNLLEESSRSFLCMSVTFGGLWCPPLLNVTKWQWVNERRHAMHNQHMCVPKTDHSLFDFRGIANQSWAWLKWSTQNRPLHDPMSNWLFLDWHLEWSHWSVLGPFWAASPFIHDLCTHLLIGYGEPIGIRCLYLKARVATKLF